MKLQKILILSLGLLILGGCNQIKYNSSWCENDVTVDGDDSEWQGAQMVPKKLRVAVGVKNDNDNLYLSFRTPDRSTMMQVLGLGFTVWIDPKGGKREAWGIKYPVGSGMQEMGMLMRTMRMNPEEVDRQVEQMLQMQSFAQIIDPENRFRTIPLSQSEIVDICLQYSNGQLIYELKLPLASDFNDIENTRLEPGSVVGIGITTPEIDMADMMGGGRPESGMPGGGMSGGRGGGGMGGGRGGGGMSGGGKGGGRGGGMSSPPGGGDRQMPEAMDLWLKITLAEE